MLKTASWLVAAAAVATLFVAPAFADDMKTDKPMAAKPAAAAKPMAAPKKHHAMSCSDYAYESKAAKDCMDKEAKKAAPHKAMHHKAMKKKEDMKKTDMKKPDAKKS